MNWIHDYQLFLFDLDGLLVNTEEIHYRAYQKMVGDRGYQLDWDFPRYCQAAHYDNTRLKEHIYADFPELYQREPNWDVLYAEKRQAMVDFLHAGAIQLMPGVEGLLSALQASNIRRCVCTHSSDDLVSIIRSKNPILNSIPEWITRHDYTHAKPHPECYQIAIKKLGKPGDRIIGFEDTPRGLTALLETEAKAVLVSQVPYPEISDFLKRGAVHHSSLLEIG